MSILETQRAPKLAPNYERHRVVEGAIDTGTITDKRRGMNMESHSHAHVQVLPRNGASPNAKILFYSDELAQFIEPHTDQAVEFTSVGQNVPYEFTFEPRGRVIFVFLEGAITGDDAVTVMVAGFNVERV